ncbi:hypothetical protein J8J40_21850, partial [Mycobacterium tuberculosis]|nr:hypothetical protein [Mycobacterium tuberculosis]
MYTSQKDDRADEGAVELAEAADDQHDQRVGRQFERHAVEPDHLRGDGAERAAEAGADWFSDFRALDASFADARRAGSFVQPVDGTVTGSISGKRPVPKSDRLGRDPTPAAPKAVAAPPAATPGRQALVGTSAKAAAFGALAPAPW